MNSYYYIEEENTKPALNKRKIALALKENENANNEMKKNGKKKKTPTLGK